MTKLSGGLLPFDLAATGNQMRDLAERFGYRAIRIGLGDHLAVVGRGAEELGVEWYGSDPGQIEPGAKIFDIDLGPLCQANLVDDQTRRRIGGPLLAKQVDDVLGVRRLARSGSTVSTISSAVSNVFLTHDVHTCGKSRTTAGTPLRATSIT